MQRWKQVQRKLKEDRTLEHTSHGLSCFRFDNIGPVQQFPKQVDRQKVFFL